MSTRFSWFPVELLIIAALLFGLSSCAAAGTFDFPKSREELNQKQLDFLNSIPNNEWQNVADYGIESVNKEKRLEDNLLNSQITVEHGSLSHAQLLDTLPNTEAKEDSEIAKKILKSGLYVYNGKCLPHGINGVDCQRYLADKPLPDNSELKDECIEMAQSRRDGHHPFRRLLERNYRDGFYEMYAENRLPLPLLISNKALHTHNGTLQPERYDDNEHNLALMQWSQFIEHDLSKPVVTSMSNGQSIECCNREHYKLQPRHHHPACAPLYGHDAAHKFGRVRCLNYVRSALAVASKCTFGTVEQLNQATGNLDLSQLYGFTDRAQERMRAYRDGALKSNSAAQIYQALLPLAMENSQAFCAIKLSEQNSTTCFMAGDSRVNSNPFAIAIYTIFLRNHNHIAQKLKAQHTKWSDEHLFAIAKSINVDIYRRIIFQEWLPAVLGVRLAAEINERSEVKRTSGKSFENLQISNEFAVAAIRFYFSMMPNALHSFATFKPVDELSHSNVLPDTNIFVFENENYKPAQMYTAHKLNVILESLLHQRAMKMDTSYENSFITNNLASARPTHADILAFDIQRGRDHGLQGYIKYLEICNNVQINGWQDLASFIAHEDINKLRSVYDSVADIDLIVGGIAERPKDDSTIGPTFACIIAEQFSKIRQWQTMLTTTNAESSDLANYKTLTAAEILCMNAELQQVPKDIFSLASEKNPLISCDDRLKGTYF